MTQNFPTSLDDEYEFMCKENTMHLWLANDAAKKVIGNSLEYIRDIYGSSTALKVKNKVGDECNRRGYCKGRYWSYPKNKTPYPSLISFWDRPSSEQLKKICEKLNIDVDKTIFVNCGTVKEYIDEGHNGHKSWEFEEKPNWKLPKKLIEIIKNFHNSSSSWAAEKEIKGWPTIAQRNAMIYQEEKEPKTIKENNKDMKNNYTKEFSNYLQIMSEALNKKDFAVYDAAKEMLEETVEDCKHEKQLAEQLNTTNFGILNHIFEERLPELFKTNKKAVRDVIKTIREDKNLMGEFNYYNAIRQYKGKIAEKISPDMIMSKLNEAIVATINKSTVIESNKKFRKVLKENNIIPNDFVDDEMKELYESGHNILTKNSGSINNVMVIAESSDNIKSYMDKHKTDAVKEAIDPDKLVREYKEKLKDTLTESEMSFVQQITDWRSPIAEQRKEKLFNKFKNECIDKINEMLKEDKDNVELKGLSDQINEMSFNKDTIVKDIAKLLEIRDILLDE